MLSNLAVFHYEKISVKFSIVTHNGSHSQKLIFVRTGDYNLLYAILKLTSSSIWNAQEETQSYIRYGRVIQLFSSLGPRCFSVTPNGQETSAL
jgi:hypothetical protein